MGRFTESGVDMRRKVSRLKHGVFERSGEAAAGEAISAVRYNLIIGLALCWGFLANWWIVTQVPYESILSIHPIVFVLGYFAMAFSGVMIFERSDSPLLSFLGYNLVVIPFGLVLNIAIRQYDPVIVTEAIRVTGLVVLGMMALGSLVPAFFERIHRSLSMALGIVIVVMLVEIFVFRMTHGILDWAIVVIFCGYIGYDWARANRIPKTVDNAIDSAAALYIDIINLFLRILRILGRRRR